MYQYISMVKGEQEVLKTEDYKVAKKLKPYAEYQIIAELMGFINPIRILHSLSLQKVFNTG